mmetsp:Transcript_26715/g.48125  ORF Transcript_26715/g.48125 Transcript_26715/m.48125 type:complete len:127 (-) Transcript_26715:3824-4204(-)
MDGGFDKKKVGVGLMLLGISLYVLGLVFLIDRFFLVLGNLSFLAGMSSFVGSFQMVTFFFRPSNLKGSLCYFSGLFLLLVGWGVLGTALQVSGLFFLFKDFIPKLAKTYGPSRWLKWRGTTVLLPI